MTTNAPRVPLRYVGATAMAVGLLVAGVALETFDGLARSVAPMLQGAALVLAALLVVAIPVVGLRVERGWGARLCLAGLWVVDVLVCVLIALPILVPFESWCGRLLSE